MPVLYTPLEEHHKTILKSCFFSVIEDIKQALQIPKDTIVSMHRGVEVSRTDNRTNVSVREDSNVPATVSQRRILANVTDNYDEDSLSSTVVSQQDTYPVFHDPDVDVSCYPVYVKTQVKIDLQYVCGSKTEALKVRDGFRIKLSQGANILHHEVEYNVLLPEPVQEFIADVYDLKNRLYPQSLEEYFLSHATKRVHRITDMANAGNAKIAVHERQVRIVGAFDFSGEPPEVEQNPETNSYKITIPYSFSLDVPRGMCMKYPPMVCNRLMPSKYLSFIEERKVKTREEYSRNLGATHSLAALSHFEAHRQIGMQVQEKLPLNLPLFDEFHERTGHRGYVITASFLTDVDESNCKGLLNLRELGDFYLDETLLQFIAGGERQWIVNPYMSPFYLAVHQAERHFNNNILEIDTELNVRSKVKLSLLKPVRITLGVCLDTSALNPTVLPRLIERKDIFLLYLSELVRGITNYRAEFSLMGVSLPTFYRNFVLVLSDAVNREDSEFVKEFMRIFVLDRRMMQELVGTLRGNYPRLYEKLCKVVDLEPHRYNDLYARGATGQERYAMRTVMHTSVSVAGVMAGGS